MLFFSGPILRRRSGVVLGAGSKMGYFSGGIGEVSFYLNKNELHNFH